MKPTLDQEWKIKQLGLILMPPLPPWWPTWGFITDKGGYIPTSEQFLDRQLERLAIEAGVVLEDFEYA